MREKLLMTFVFTLLFLFTTGTEFVSASPIHSSVDENEVILINENELTSDIEVKSANFTDKFNLSGFHQHRSRTFDVNKVFGTDHNAIYVKASFTSANPKYTIRLWKNNSVIRTVSGTAPSVAFTQENCNDPKASYHVTINNERSTSLTGSVYVNTRIN